MNRIITTLLSVAFFPLLVEAQQTPVIQSYVQDPTASIRDHNVDMQHLLLSLSFEPEAGFLKGTATYRFQPLQQYVDTLFLDAPGISIADVKLDGKNTRFSVSEAGVTIYFAPTLEWGSMHTLTIQYSATPTVGLYFVGWNEDTRSIANDPNRIRKQIWSQGQGTDNRFWIPSYDDVNDKLVTEMVVSFDKKYAVVSNGSLLEMQGSGENRIWHFKMEHPHSNYLIMLAIGDYMHKDYTSKNGIVSRQYFYPDREASVEPTYQYSAEMMDWLSTETGLPYPWETYANVPVQEFLYGAMENTTATIYTDVLFQDEHAQTDRSYIATNAHELTHQWFGDYVTEWSATEHWLQESFATHYSKKFQQAIFGDDHFQWIRRQEMINAINADNRDSYPLAHSLAGSARHYPKGSFVLDMMRYVMGNDQFRKVVTDYLLAHPYDNVWTADLEIQCMRSLGMNMQWFFDEWVYRAGYPIYQVETKITAGETNIHVAQIQDSTATQGLFRMPIEFQVHYTDGGFDAETHWISEKETDLTISNILMREVAFVLFDPGTEIMSAVDFKKDYTTLRYQAYNAPLMIDRYDAIFSMRDTDVSTKRKDLVALYAKESFHGIRAEIIFQLAKDDHKESINLLKAALTDSEPLIRRAVLNGLDNIPAKLKKDIVILLRDADYTNAELTLKFLAEKDPKNLNKYLQQSDGQMGANKNIRITWLELAYGNGNQAAIDELALYCSSIYEFRTRTIAMQSVARIGYCNNTIADNLVQASLSFNRRLANPARSILRNFLDEKGYAEVVKAAVERSRQQGGDAVKLDRILEKK